MEIPCDSQIPLSAMLSSGPRQGAPFGPLSWSMKAGLRPSPGPSPLFPSYGAKDGLPRPQPPLLAAVSYCHKLDAAVVDLFFFFFSQKMLRPFLCNQHRRRFHGCGPNRAPPRAAAFVPFSLPCARAVPVASGLFSTFLGSAISLFALPVPFRVSVDTPRQVRFLSYLPDAHRPSRAPFSSRAFPDPPLLKRRF